MKIVFYSTNSNHNKSELQFSMLPSCQNQWKLLKEKYPEFDFTVVMQKPGMFLCDDFDGRNNYSCNEYNNCKNLENLKSEKTNNVKFIFIEEENSDIQKIADIIILQKPDIAIAVTYWIQPFDWLSIKDSMIAEILQSKNIKTICHNSHTAEICFDKNKTHNFLVQNNFNCAPAVYVHHEMFFAQRNRLMLAENVYRNFVFSQIRKLKLPLVIKDTFGLSSFGMDVASTYEEAIHILKSKKNNGDRIVEEFIDGLSFGIEVYGTNGNYTITPPLINSTNQFGLTSPKQNVKLGPVENPTFKISELQKEILRLAKLLEFSGIAQIDLLFSKDKWYIVEINSRISGMTQTMAASMNKSLYELILFSAELIQFKPEYLQVMNLKFPLLSEKKRKLLLSQEFIKAVNQIENKEAKQLREVGYTEVIFGCHSSLEKVMNNLETLNQLLPDEMEKVFYTNAYKLAKTIEYKKTKLNSNLEFSSNIHFIESFEKTKLVKAFYTSNKIYSWKYGNANWLENYKKLANILNISENQICTTNQTHTNCVRVVTEENYGEGVLFPTKITNYDGIITNRKKLLLCSFEADCVPVYFLDFVNQAIGLCHSGWKGTSKLIAKKTIEAMAREYGSKPQNILITIGPCACKNCYEVGKDLIPEFQNNFPIEKIFLPKDDKKYFLDLQTAIQFTLEQAGILKDNIFCVNKCTIESNELCSFRRTKSKVEHILTAIMLK